MSVFQARPGRFACRCTGVLGVSRLYPWRTSGCATLRRYPVAYTPPPRGSVTLARRLGAVSAPHRLIPAPAYPRRMLRQCLQSEAVPRLDK